MFETKLSETTRRLEQQLVEEQDARLRAEETVREAQPKSVYISSNPLVKQDV